MTMAAIPRKHILRSSLFVFIYLLAFHKLDQRRHIHTHRSDADNPLSPQSSRRLSIALPNGGCQITWPKPPPPNIQITYAASYPGCGARMTWNLVEALTGLQTGDDWNNNGRGSNVVTVKTHYPQSNGILVDFDDKITRVFLVVRNPMHSIPSFFNHIYEMRNHLPVHSERAPVEEWLKWRDHYLEEEIREYKKFLIYWMDRYTPENRYIITYEGLTDDVIGAEVAKGLNDFLGKATGVEPIDRESVPCIWKAVVKNQPPEHQKEQIERLQNGKQREMEAGPLSGGFAPSEEGRTGSQTEATANTPSSNIADTNENGSALQQLEQIEQQLNQLDLLNSASAPNEHSPLPPVPPPQQPTRFANDEKSQGQFQQQPQEYGLYPELKTMQYNPRQPMPYEHQTPGNLRHRRLDPGHHDSQRKGPNVPRPYTPKQLELMMEMLLEVGERYKDDLRLGNIMKGYYEKVQLAKNELLAQQPPSGLVEPPGGFY